MLIDGAQMKYKQFVMDFALIKLVYGEAGMFTQNTRELHRSLQSPLPIPVLCM